MKKVFLIYYEQMENLIIEYCISLYNKFINVEIINYSKNKNIEYNDNNIYIYFGLAYTNFHFINKNNVFIINLEQLSINGLHSQYNFLQSLIDFSKKYSNIKIFDYSLANIKILENYGIVSNYLPYQVNKNEIYNYKKIFDYVLCCSFNERKNYIYNSLTKYFNNHIFIGKPCKYGKDRDDILFSSKVLVNIHHRENDYTILEEIRIIRCILNKVIVISEKSDNHELFPLSKYIIFSKYEDIIETTINVLHNYNIFYEQIFKDFNIEYIDSLLNNYLIMNLDKNILINSLYEKIKI